MNPAPWEAPLARARAGDHLVLLHEEDRFLYDGVSLYLSEALRQGRRALVIATHSHCVGIRAAVGARGALSGGPDRMVFLDAGEVLSRLLVGGWPPPALFRNILGEELERVSAGSEGPPVVYEEMPDLLFQREQRGQASRLEDLWAGLGRTHPFTLLHSYRLALFDPRPGNSLREIALSHTHIVPLRDYDRLEAALDRALNEAMGVEGPFLRSLLATYPPPLPQMPPAAAALLWLRESLPSLAEPIIARTGELYRAACEAPVAPPA